jgi:hypothetical protein
MSTLIPPPDGIGSATEPTSPPVDNLEPSRDRDGQLSQTRDAYLSYL